LEQKQVSKHCTLHRIDVSTETQWTSQLLATTMKQTVHTTR